MAINTPQFSPTRGEGSTYNGFTFSGGQWAPTPTQGGGGSGLGITTPRPNPAIVTTGANWANYNDATSQLNSFINGTDPYAQLFQQQRTANELTAQNAIGSATAATERAKVRGEQERMATTAGLATAAEKTGLAPNSAYQIQVMQGAKDQFNTRFALLDQQEKMAIARAKNAQTIGDTAVLKEQLDYAKQLRDEKAKAQQSALELDWKMYEFNNLSAAQKAANDIARSKISTKKTAASFTPTELRKLKQAGLDGADEQIQLNFLYGKNKGVAPMKASEFTKDYVVETYGQDEVYNLGKALGVEDNTGLFGRNWSKNNEIKALFNDPKLSSYVQQMLASGYDIQDIIDAQ